MLQLCYFIEWQSLSVASASSKLRIEKAHNRSCAGKQKTETTLPQKRGGKQHAGKQTLPKGELAKDAQPQHPLNPSKRERKAT